VEEPEENRPLGKHRLRWEDNINVILLINIGINDWIDLAQNREGWRALVNAVMNLRFP
jgi:hypothetical protein